MAFTMKLQSPDYDGNTHGYELALPVNQDTYQGDSMAALLALFDGKNKLLDFRQLRETVVLVGVFTVPAAGTAGFSNPIQMRDEAMRIRRAAATFGKNTTGTSKSWINEGGTGFNFAAALDGGGQRTWGSTTLPAAEQDSSTARVAGTCRLIYDQYWDPSAGSYKNLFLYGTVSNVNFGPRPGATTLTRIPFAVSFIVADIKTGDT